MAEVTAAPWLATMRELAGTKEFPGGENNPTILGWASFIGNRYTDMASYCAQYRRDDIAWCGLTAGYCLSKNGIRPPFGETDTDKFLWANSFDDPWGIRLDGPKPGCIVVFNWRSGGGHVGFLDRVDGSTLYVYGGNQSDNVTVAPFKWDDQVVGFFWPPAVAAQPAAVRTPADVRRRMGQAITAAEVRRENGHIAVYWLPANDGGGAYEVAGINVRYHPAAAAQLKGLIEAGRYQEAENFVGDYTATYTDVADAWTVSWGIEFYLRDCVFNRGPGGAAIILQLALKSLGEDIGSDGPKRDGVDGQVGPLTADALRRREGDVEAVLKALRQAREFYERHGHEYIKGGPQRNESNSLWNGLINRFNNALTVARQFAAEQPKEPQVSEPTTTTPPAATDVVKEIQGLRQDIAALTAGIGAILSAIRGGAAGGTVEPKPIPADPDPEPAPAPAPAPSPSTSVFDRPGVGLGIMSGAAALIGHLFGIQPLTDGSNAGMVLPAIAATSTAVGLSGWGGIIVSAIGEVAKMYANRNAKK